MADVYSQKSYVLENSTEQVNTEVKIYQLLKRLCINSCPLVPKTATTEAKEQLQQLVEFMFSHSLQQLTLGSRLPRTLLDQGSVVRRVQKNLIQQKRDSTTAVFSESVAKLDKCVRDRDLRYSLLSFMLRMMDDGTTYHNSTLIPDLSSTLSIHKMGFLSDMNLSNVTSGISLGFDPTASTVMQQQSPRSTPYKPNQSNQSLKHSRSRAGSSPKRLDALSCYMTPFSHLEYGPTWKICEQDLVRDMIFIFQGTSGTHLLWDNHKHVFYFSEEIRLPLPIQGICMKLAELGKLYQKINLFVTDNQKDPQKPSRPQELLAHAFKTALKDHLFEYYRFISVLDEKLHREASNPEEPSLLSLKRLMVWSYEPLQCFQMLSNVLDHCYSLSGCKLMNKIYEFSRTGHPEHAVLLNSILGKLFSPFKSVLDKWLYEGDLPTKANSQFFIKENSISYHSSEDLWEKKYELLRDQVPSFISDELALKVMVTGKSINFLKEKCQEQNAIFDIIDILNKSGDETFDSLIDGRVEIRIREAYGITCAHLLDVLKEKFHFNEHLKAMRRYLLLGQGDFIKMLMELLYHDLERDGREILKHNLMTLMGDAIRATNARFDEPYILDRLDITLMEATEREKGWDVFSLFYHFRDGGPLSCIFSQKKVMVSYLKIFNFIWRAQRTEFILSKAWKNLQAYDRKFARSLRLGEVFHMSHALISAMIHFTRQVHYYLSFEVLTCSWEELQGRLQKASDLDQLKEAHFDFLTSVSTYCFLSQVDKPLSLRYRGISDEVVRYISVLDNLYTRCEDEKLRRRNFKLRANIGDRSGVIDDAEKEERVKFNIAIEEEISPDLRIISSTLMRFFWQFVRGLKEHKNANFRLFATRLDFNGFFQRYVPDSD